MCYMVLVIVILFIYLFYCILLISSFKFSLGFHVFSEDKSLKTFFNIYFYIYNR